MVNREKEARSDAQKAGDERTAQLQRQLPGTDLKLEPSWWRSATDFTFDVKARCAVDSVYLINLFFSAAVSSSNQEKMDRPTLDMNAILVRRFVQPMEPAAAERTKQEASKCLREQARIL
ncbi:hypothetical protein ISF_06720 [Cordyceps fumosorosea ARSEF 2679]|uniref:Uncharacterized protein n=1 Tax=Cordyceps fumosorosea (strain ARSEF 2679) TaxID=1081104 RepID=A0A167R1G8_CORFA|nr:hypothetical protein ISF_06720 [Cordyceps fumosorosea ARSEF 2679]OAA58181.1 hypothetical protein ISF_06720 [Cordyceps fumosorosea ARSEF 2679]